MTNSELPDKILHSLSGGYFRLAAVWGWLTTSAQLLALLVAAVPTLRGATSPWTPVLLAGTAYAMAISRWLSDKAAAAGDKLLRRLEFFDGLGRPIHARELADLRDDASVIATFLSPKAKNRESYFASSLPPGPARGIANTYESAWWTHRLAKDMAYLEATRFMLILVVAVLVLRASTLSHAEASVGRELTELATALILFLITQGPLKRLLDYVTLSNSARDIVARCEKYYSGSEPISGTDAIDVMTTYQLVRKGAPRIPTLLWGLRRGRLNRFWRPVETDSHFKSA